jgi:hypothetical protein
VSYKTMNNPRRLSSPDAASVIAAAAAQSARCERGEHDEAAAEKGRVTYLGHGKRIEPGTRYCWRCQVILPVGQAPAPRAAEAEEP